MAHIQARTMQSFTDSSMVIAMGDWVPGVKQSLPRAARTFRQRPGYRGDHRSQGYPCHHQALGPQM